MWDPDPWLNCGHQFSRDEYRGGIELFVPTRLKNVLVEDEKRRLKEDEKEETAAREARARAAELTRNPSQTPVRAGTDTEKTKDDIEREKEMLAWRQIDDADKTLRSCKNFIVFKSQQALALLKSLGKGDSEDKARLDNIYRELVQRGTTLREIARPKSLKPLEELAAKQPHMKEVVNFVMAQINMAQRSRQPVRLQPMLLVGEGGGWKNSLCPSFGTGLVHHHPYPATGLGSDLFHLSRFRPQVEQQHARHSV